jgi:tetratricopeptide (TPR) repeat protein
MVEIFLRTFLLLLILSVPVNASNGVAMPGQATASQVKTYIEEQNSAEKKELSADQWLEKGMQLAEQKKFNEAIAAYEQAIKVNPRMDSAYAERGKAYLFTRQYGAALEDFSQATEISPRNAEYIWFKGLAYAGKGQHQLAIEQYKQTLTVNSAMYMAYWNLGLSYERLGMRDEANKAFTAFVENAPSNYPNYDLAKSRLQQTLATGAINQNQIHKFIFDYLKTDYLAIDFKDDRWKLGFEDLSKNIILEFVSGNETVNNWSELITIQFIGDYKNITPQQYASLLKKRYSSYGEKMSFAVLREAEKDLLIEYRLSGHSGMQDEHTITRIIKGKGCLVFVHYAAKPFMSPEQKALGLTIIENARYYDHFPN